MEALNHALFLLINAGPDPSPLLLYSVLVCAKWLVFLLPMLLLGLWLWGGVHFRQVVIKALLAVMVGIVVVYLLRLSWPQPRPFVINVGFTYLHHAADPSFPSNHAVFSFSIALTLLLNSMRKIGWLVLFIALLVSWARVFLGVHFPMDMLAALFVAFVIVLAIKRLFQVRRGGERLLAILEAVYRRLLAWPIAKGWIAK